MSTQMSKLRLARLHDTMAGYVERGAVPGVVTLVCRGDELHVDALGEKALGGEPMQRDTLFRISSMTKPITAAATLILVEECALRLDDPVDRLLPELADRRVLRTLGSPLDDTVPARRPITVRDLLTFRFGFGVVMAMPDTYPIQTAAVALRIDQGPPNPATMPTPDRWIAGLGSLPLMHQPGAQWMYNTGSDVLGVLIARASGQPFDTFLRERIFEPLGMKDTDFHVPPEKLHRFATSYSTNPRTGALGVYDPPDGQWSKPPIFPSGAGGLCSTVDDYLAFAKMLLQKGQHNNRRILSRPSVEAMTTDQLTPEQKAIPGLVDGYFDTHGWGFGVSIVTRRSSISETVGKFGWDGGLGSTGYMDPAENLITILMTQAAWTRPVPPDIAQDFQTGVYSAMDE